MRSKKKKKPIAPCTREFSQAFGKLRVIARNSDWLIALFAAVVIGRSKYYGIAFSQVFEKLSYAKSETPSNECLLRPITINEYNQRSHSQR